MTEPAEQTKYNWTDAWLLLAIIYANKNGPGSLERIFAAGDLINRNIFKPEELQSGLARLAAGEYISRTKQGFDITEKMIETAGKLSRRSGYIREELEQIEHVLKTSRRQPLQPNNLQYAGFSISAYKAGLKKYMSNFAV